jgi:hypothetical protein
MLDEAVMCPKVKPRTSTTSALRCSTILVIETPKVSGHLEAATIRESLKAILVRICQKTPDFLLRASMTDSISLTYTKFDRVTDGARTRDLL